MVPKDLHVQILGYCALTESEAGRLFLAGRLDDIYAAHGNFVIVFSFHSGIAILTSKSGVIPYYFTLTDHGFFYGNNIADIMAQAGLGMRWNYQALADYIFLDHVIGGETFHADISRTQAGSLVSYVGSKLTTTFAPPSAVNTTIDAQQKALLELTREVLASWKPGSILCLTGGLDSRLLLAILLRAELKPDVLTAGTRDSFDFKVAKSIAGHFDLRMTACEIQASDFMASASTIANATNGALPAGHWPGILFSRYAGNSALILGFNGEFARCYYDDRGIRSLAVAATGSHGRFAQKLWSKRFHRPFSQAQLSQIHPELAKHMSGDGARACVERLMNRNLSLAEALDDSFLTHYSRNKTGADLAAIAAHCEFTVPFFAAEWIAAAKHMPRTQKLRSQHHRRAIAALMPELASFPLECDQEKRPLDFSSLAYWVKDRTIRPIAGFYDPAVLTNNALLDQFESAMYRLEDLFDAGLLRTVARLPSLRRLFLQLATVALWRESCANTTRPCSQKLGPVHQAI